MKSSKKRMSNKKFASIFLPLASIFLVICIIVTMLMQYWSTVMDAAFGGSEIITSSAVGTENWDTDYYGLNQPGMTKEETAADGATLARIAEAEGIVLLKNQNNALPLTNNGDMLSQSNEMTVNALGCP